MRDTLARFAFGAALASVAALAPACVSDPFDPAPACCDAACVAMAGSYDFVSSGAPVAIVGRVVITDTATDTVLIDQELDGFDHLEASVGNFDLDDYEGGEATLRVEVTAGGYEPTQEDVTLTVQRTQICCDSCSTSSERFDVELTPIGT